MQFKKVIMALGVLLSVGCASTTNTSSNADTKPVTVGDVQKVKGLNDVDGEIVGKPAANSKFSALKIGMSMQQVKSAIGEPSDAGEYETGKRWIPFYYGDDMRRTEFVYKGMGRLTFASGSTFGGHGGALIRITHNANEVGTR